MIGNIPSIRLNNDRLMPMVGLGVYKATKPGEVEAAISTAFCEGYRAIDTASVYKNEDGVGRAIRSSHLSRDEIFVTTKVWNNAQRVGDRWAHGPRRGSSHGRSEHRPDPWPARTGAGTPAGRRPRGHRSPPAWRPWWGYHKPS